MKAARVVMVVVVLAVSGTPRRRSQRNRKMDKIRSEEIERILWSLIGSQVVILLGKQTRSPSPKVSYASFLI
jgi:hypothetical protein